MRSSPRVFRVLPRFAVALAASLFLLSPATAASADDHDATSSTSSSIVTSRTDSAGTGTTDTGSADTGGSVSVTADSVPADAVEGLVSSWPSDGVMLWVPPKEGRFTFGVPVRASTFEVTVARTDGILIADDAVDRLTSGEAVTEILLRLPQIRPGMHEITWSVETATGTQLSGTVGFGLEGPIAAVGGQNHRHGESHLYEDTPGQFALRLLFVISVAFLFAGFRRSRARGETGALDKVLVRTGSALLLVAGLITTIVDAVAWVDEYHDQPFSALVAAPGLSLLLPLMGFAAYLLATGRVSNVLLGGGVGVFAAYAGLSHAIRTALGAELFVVFTVLLSALAFLWSEVLLAGFDALRGRTKEIGGRLRAMLFSSAALLAASLLMLVLHAGTLDLEMAFSRDLRSRLTLSVLLVGALTTLPFFASRPRLLRVLLVLPVLVVLVTSALLAWMPPPAAGL